MAALSLVVALRDRAFEPAVVALADYLTRCGHVVGAGPADAVVVVSDLPPDRTFVPPGVPVLLAGPTVVAWRDSPLMQAAGVLPGGVTPVHEMRVRPGDHLETGPLPLVEKVLDDVEVLLAANWQLTDHPVATLRGGVGLFSLGATPDALGVPATQRLLHRCLRRLLGLADGPPVRVGLLGYGAIGHEHALAVAATDGLELAAVCDRNPDRLAAAREVAPGVHAVGDADELFDGVDLVVVSTPPNTHAQWALRALDAGRHVVVEKPFCLTVAEADEMLARAAARQRVLAVYQNRRWDPDYLTLRRAVRSGAIGDVFHAETFVGGYAHPCNYWHSDEEVSGGAIYDWGSHYLDWLLDLLPHDVEWVSATAQQRVWHDVTNADHTRVTLRFSTGAEASFVHSDIAAARKPKWYLLGTRGAIRAEWQSDGFGSDVFVSTPDGYGGTHEQRLALAPVPVAPFHRELADRLRYGEPMSVTPEGARRVVAVMEAATQSARDGGRPVAPAAP